MIRSKPVVLSIVLSIALFAAAGGGSSKEAFKLFAQSEKLYRAGKFREAADLLEKAYALDPEPTLLFNRARALESAGDLAEAVVAYSLYLEKYPKAKDRVTVERRIETMRSQLAERAELDRLRLEEAKRKETPVEKPKSVELAPRDPALEHQQNAIVAKPIVVEPARSASPAPWIVAGAGVAGVITGAVLGVLASGKNNSAKDEPEQMRAQELIDSAHGLSLGANIAFIAGGVVAGGGLIWAITDL